MLCITLNVNKKRVLLVKCCPSGRLQALKNKGKISMVIQKSGRGRLRERSFMRTFHCRVLMTSQTGFHNPGRN